MFTLDPRLEADSVPVLELPLCQLRLHRDSSHPWLLLIPMRYDVTEVIDLDGSDQALLWAESTQVCHCLRRCFAPDKLNVAALGNLVPQLHLHHIARYQHDPAWPEPVWGKPIIPYEPELLSHRLSVVRDFFNKEYGHDF